MKARMLAAVLALGVCASGAWAEDLHPRDLTYDELTFQPPEPQVRTLRQGIKVILMPDRSLPLIRVAGRLKAGGFLEPEGKLGLAQLTATVARTGGAGARSAEELDEALEFAAATLEMGADWESATLGASALSRDTDLLLEVLGDVLRRPRFQADRLELARSKMLAGLRQEDDNPSTIARRELYKVVYGAGHPFARRETPETLRSITVDDLKAFHRKWFAPRNLLLGFAGDFEPDALVTRLEALFEGWTGAAPPALPKPEALFPQPGVYLVRKDLEQTTVRMCHLGLPRQDPDYPACQVMNRILGLGTFTSRMGIEIRSNRGLAYSVGSGIFEGNGPGPFIAVAQTKAASTHEVVGLMKEIIAGMSVGDITEKELSDAKNTLLNQWVFEFESPDKVVSTRVEHEFYGYPADTLKEYPRKIAAVTAADVVRCAQRYLRPSDLAVMLVGDPDKMGKPLGELGPVTEIALPKYD